LVFVSHYDTFFYQIAINFSRPECFASRLGPRFGGAAMKLHEFAKRLGGDVCGASILCPGPSHSPKDRSLSVKFSSPSDFVVASFAGDDWRACRDHVKVMLGLNEDDYKRPDSLHRKAWLATQAAQLEAERAEKVSAQRAKAAPLWASVKPLLGTVAQTYLTTARGIPLAVVLKAAEAGNLGFHPALPSLFGSKTAPTFPAMIGRAVDAQGAFVGIHATFLQADGLGKVEAIGANGKKMLGAGFMGASVRLGTGSRLVLAEGIETALSAGAFLDVCPVAALSAGGVAAWKPWQGVESVLLGVDIDPSGAGQKAAEACAASVSRIGLTVEGFALPPDGHRDFNDAMRASVRTMGEVA
jgi:putative DNA primase/helicase